MSKQSIVLSSTACILLAFVNPYIEQVYIRMTPYDFEIGEFIGLTIFYNIPVLAYSFYKKKTQIGFFLMQNFLGILGLLSRLLDLFIQNQTL